jgi:hypothetical protein
MTGGMTEGMTEGIPSVQCSAMNSIKPCLTLIADPISVRLSLQFD